MTQVTRTIGHPSLVPADIAPSNSAAFSPNLYKYIAKRAVVFKTGGLLDAVFVAKPGTVAAEWFGAGTMVLGYKDDDFFIGTRLIAALCQGAKAPKGAHACRPDGLELVEGFWERYLQIGRCAIDPEHKEHFIGTRFSESAGARQCLWCGAHQTRKTVAREIPASIVYDTVFHEDDVALAAGDATVNHRSAAPVGAQA